MLDVGRYPDVSPEPTSVLDIETGPDGAVLDIGAAWLSASGIVYQVFGGWDSWLDHVRMLIADADKSERRRYLVWWAHNGGGFDWLSLIAYLQSCEYPYARFWNAHMSSSGAVVIEIKIQYGRKGYERILRLCDSLRLLPASLNRLAQEFLREAKEEVAAHEYADMALFRAREPERYYSYIKQDVLLLQRVILALWQHIYDLEGSVGYLPVTLPALSVRVFRKTLPRPMLVPREKRLRALMADAYRGGRVECWRAEDTEGEQWDVNSMYPAVMLGEQYPISYRGGWTTSYQPGTSSVWRIRYRQHNQTIPPVLIFDGYSSESAAVYGPEIDKLIEVGADVEILEGYVFTDTANIFDKFVERYYTLRMDAKRKGNTAIAYVAKLMLNSLYGKFGQRDRNVSLEPYDRERLEDHMRAGRDVYMLSPELMQVVTTRLAPHAFPAIAGLVTARARVKLYGLIEQAGEQYIYCDTDSVVTRGPAPYTASDALGGVKLEARGRVITIAKKIKWVEGKGGTLKGVSGVSASENRDNPNLYARMLAGERVRIEFQAFPTVREVLSGNAPACQLLVRYRTVGLTQYPPAPPAG